MESTTSSLSFFIPIQHLLEEVEGRMLAQTDERFPDINSALKHLLSSGGKRVRPAVTLLTGGMLDAEPQPLVTLAAAVELLHTATLVHDDLIDGAMLRRGIATLNSQWSPAATVLTGDYIFARAARLAAETNSVAVMNLFAQTLATIVGGELTQLFARRGVADLELYHQRIYAKTASLFEAATTSAAFLSPVEEDVVEAVRCFGYSIGMAFQIVDDVLDFTGEQATVGKPVASDLRNGLITLPVLYYMKDQPEDQNLRIILNGGEIGGEAMEQLIQAIRSSGVIHQAMEDARHFVDQGLEVLSVLPDCPERRSLEELSRYIVDRQL